MAMLCITYIKKAVSNQILPITCMQITCIDNNRYRVFTLADGQSKQRLAMAHSLPRHKPPGRDPIICLRKVKKADVKDGQSSSTTSGEQVTGRSTHRKQQELSQDDWALMASYCT